MKKENCNIFITSLFIGNIMKVTDVCTSSEIKISVKNGTLEINSNTSADVEMLKENALLQVSLFDDLSFLEYSDFIDLEEDKKYESLDINVVNGTEFVDVSSLKKFEKVLNIDDKEMKKGKILQIYKEYKNSYDNGGSI